MAGFAEACNRIPIGTGLKIDASSAVPAGTVLLRLSDRQYERLRAGSAGLLFNRASKEKTNE